MVFGAGWDGGEKFKYRCPMPLAAVREPTNAIIPIIKWAVYLRWFASYCCLNEPCGRGRSFIVAGSASLAYALNLRAPEE